MKKTIIILLLIALFLACGYFLYTKFDDIKQRYLASRVNQLLAEMPTATPLAKNEEATPTSSVSSAIATAAALATAQAEEAKDVEAATAEPTIQLTAIPTEEPTLTPTIASTDPGIYLGSADWTDLMDAPKNWPVGSDDYSSAYFENGYYRMTSLADVDGWRLASTEAIKNGYIEITFTTETCSLDDHYGVMFHVPVLPEANPGYLFAITCDGRYSLRLWDEAAGSMVYLIRWKASGTINVGSNQTNVLGVMTKDGVISLYINGVLVDEYSDNTLPSGYFGVLTGWEKTENLTIRIEEASYWVDAD